MTARPDGRGMPIGRRWRAGVAATALLVVAGSACEPARVDLTPAGWSTAELERYDALTWASQRARTVAEGHDGMIAASSGALAVRAGLEALRQGGTAADAALTTSLAQIALAMGSSVSYAGFLTMVYYDAGSGEVHALNAGFNTVFGEDDPLSIPHMGTPSGRTALVPGFMAGVQAAHDRFGRLPFAAIFGPAIYFAEDGFVLTDRTAARIRGRADVLTRLEATRAIFTDADGELPQPGDRFRQPELARTLRCVAAHGAEYMYRGEWARRFVAAVRAEGGHMTLEDLAAYQPIWDSPAHTRYRAFDIYATPPPNFGGVNLIEALNVLEAAGMPRTEAHYTSSAEDLYWMIQIGRLAALIGLPGAGRGLPPDLATRYLGAEDLSLVSRLEKATAERLWSTMRGEGWRRLLASAQAERVRASDVSDAVLRARPRPAHSDGVVAVDADGNIAAVLHTINTVSWGTTGIFVDGISVPDPASFQQELIRRVGPGVRLPDPSNPFVVLRAGRPFLGGSSIGSGLHVATLQSLVNVLDYGMDPQSATSAPQFMRTEWIAVEADVQTVLAGAIARPVLDGVRARGQRVKEVGETETGLLRGYWMGVQVEPGTGRLLGGATPFGPTFAEGLGEEGITPARARSRARGTGGVPSC